MIISRTKAASMVADYSLVYAIPEILPLVEEYKAAKLASEKEKCTPCAQKRIFGPIGDKVLRFLSSLAPEKLNVLKTHLKTNEIYIYPPGEAGGTLKKLG